MKMGNALTPTSNPIGIRIFFLDKISFLVWVYIAHHWPVLREDFGRVSKARRTGISLCGSWDASIPCAYIIFPMCCITGAQPQIQTHMVSGKEISQQPPA